MEIIAGIILAGYVMKLWLKNQALEKALVEVQQKGYRLVEDSEKLLAYHESYKDMTTRVLHALTDAGVELEYNGDEVHVRFQTAETVEEASGARRVS